MNEPVDNVQHTGTLTPAHTKADRPQKNTVGLPNRYLPVFGCNNDNKREVNNQKQHCWQLAEFVFAACFTGTNSNGGTYRISAKREIVVLSIYTMS